MNQQRLTYIFYILGALMVAGGIYFFFFTMKGKEGARQILRQPIMVADTLVIPDTKNMVSIDTRIPNDKAYKVLLVPKNGSEEVVVSNAVLTLKESYARSSTDATIWAADAKLVLIKSLGTLTLEGRSSAWQIVFGSKAKKKGYEVVIEGGAVVSKKEIISNMYGYDVPKNWYDVMEAIVSLQTLPQFADATVSGITFYYNLEGKEWGYGLATSRGATAMPVK